jgi:hypothetical protein
VNNTLRVVCTKNNIFSANAWIDIVEALMVRISSSIYTSILCMTNCFVAIIAIQVNHGLEELFMGTIVGSFSVGTLSHRMQAALLVCYLPYT